jgi:hypothetical protein
MPVSPGKSVVVLDTFLPCERLADRALDVRYWQGKSGKQATAYQRRCTAPSPMLRRLGN